MYGRLKVFVILFVLITFGAGAAFFADTAMKEYTQWRFESRLAFLGHIEEFKPAADYITKIAHTEGGAYAFKLLIESDFTEGLDTHLLGHYAGNVLYEQEGLNGMRFCTTDLWYACAHSLVINDLLKEGMSVFSVIGDVCSQVSGPAGYDLCFHGFGHGVIAYAEYELPKALELCSGLGTEEHNYTEARECAGGVIMDLRDGMHDKDLWKQFGQKYIQESNPTEICEANYMPNEFRQVCMFYITPFIFDKIGVGKQIPSDIQIEEALANCEAVLDEELRRSCYGGFPKELISYIHNRDVRVYEQSTDAELSKMYDPCSLAPSGLGVESCVKRSVGALDRRGTHSYTLALRYCDLLPENPTLQNICYRQLIKERSYERIAPFENEGLCENLSSLYREECQEFFR